MFSSPELAPLFVFYFLGVPLFSTNQARKICCCWGPNSSRVFAEALYPLHKPLCMDPRMGPPDSFQPFAQRHSRKQPHAEGLPRDLGSPPNRFLFRTSGVKPMEHPFVFCFSGSVLVVHGRIVLVGSNSRPCYSLKWGAPCCSDGVCTNCDEFHHV